MIYPVSIVGLLLTCESRAIGMKKNVETCCNEDIPGGFAQCPFIDPPYGIRGTVILDFRHVGLLFERTNRVGTKTRRILVQSAMLANQRLLGT
ncbi:hypothetical protein TNCV_4471521 [Trichonephila clavipes]|uniref:Uncharacterized protein n=1 Tax=Trichonephila clavipes TaxID=2585209 RepID=A0A8X6SMP7_TRICX|nr:hypothetical protein TNCV_4471521 [Trichonephila clavipes]